MEDRINRAPLKRTDEMNVHRSPQQQQRDESVFFLSHSRKILNKVWYTANKETKMNYNRDKKKSITRLWHCQVYMSRFILATVGRSLTGTNIFCILRLEYASSRVNSRTELQRFQRSPERKINQFFCCIYCSSALSLIGFYGEETFVNRNYRLDD